MRNTFNYLNFSTITALSVGSFAMIGVSNAESDADKISFFITSAGPGNGGDLGGLERFS